MRTYYPNNSRHNKAAMCFDAFSADTQEAMIELALLKGRGLVSELASSKEGAPKPLAMFSEAHISNEDFPLVWMGMQTVILASMRNISADFDFYEDTLMKAFSMPKAMASEMAKRIETVDVLGGLTADDKRAWYTKINERIQETIRKSSNWVTSVLQLPFENDQDQKYDIDFLYECRLLGKAVDDLSARARLMTAQAAISQGMGLFNTAQTSAGDVENFGDPVTGSEVMIGEAFQPLMMAKLPPSVFGGSKGLAMLGHTASQAHTQKLASEAGISRASDNKTHTASPALRTAFKKISHMSPGKIALVAAAAGFAPIAIKTLIDMAHKVKGTKAAGDVLSDIAVQYGDTAADLLAQGDIEDFMGHIFEMANSPATTGDAEMDEAIIGDVLGEFAEEGDPVEDGDAEMGGIFKRARIHHAIKKGKHRRRKAAKRDAKSHRKDVEAQQLMDAKDFKNSQYENMDDSGLAGNEEAQYSQDESSPQMQANEVAQADMDNV